jgi:GIY-YIG catalytic domain
MKQKKYSFNSNNAPHSSGIYVIFFSKMLVYIGKSSNLKRRISNHIGEASRASIFSRNLRRLLDLNDKHDISDIQQSLSYSFLEIDEPKLSLVENFALETMKPIMNEGYLGKISTIETLSNEAIDRSKALQTSYDNINESFYDIKNTFSPEQNQISEEKGINTTLESIGGDIKEIQLIMENLSEKIDQIVEYNKPKTSIQRLSELIYENLVAIFFMILVVALLGYFGFSWLLG